MTHALLRAKLVNGLKRSGVIRTPAVEAALLAVPREHFLPDTPLDVVYSDAPVPIKRCDGVIVSGSSQPSMMAIMLEQLQLRPGHRVLEIGAGTGYNAALIQELVGRDGHVVTLDVDQDIVARAKAGLKAAGHGRVQVECKDGSLGFAEAGPYDRVVLTVGAWDIAPAWIEQLKPDGILLMPLWLTGVEVMVAFRRKDDYLASTGVSRCTFMRLRGLMSGPEGRVSLDESTDLAIEVEDREQIDAAATFAQLRGEPLDQKLALSVTPAELANLGVWLALRRANFCIVTMISDQEIDIPVSWPQRTGAFRETFGLRDPAGICLLSLGQGGIRAATAGSVLELGIRQFGDACQLARELAAEIHAWDTAKRPSVSQYRVDAHPRDPAATRAAGPSERLIDKTHTTLLVTCPWQE